MTYASGGLIQFSDYSSFLSTFNGLWSTGSASSGYGQAAVVATSSQGAVVNATDWATLISKMSTMQQHQNNTTFAQTQPTAGTLISYLSSINTELSSLTTNKLSTYAYSAAQNSTNITNTASWHTSSTKTWTVTFSSGDAARYFFNTGGYIQVYSGANSISPTTWNSFVNTGFLSVNLYASSFLHNGTVGTYTRGTYTSGSGYYNLTTSPVTFFSMTETGTGNSNYNANSIVVNISANGAQGANGDKGSVLTITLQLNDNDANTFGYTNTGTTAAYISVVPSETTYLTNSWGSVTVANTVNTQA